MGLVLEREGGYPLSIAGSKTLCLRLPGALIPIGKDPSLSISEPSLHVCAWPGHGLKWKTGKEQSTRMLRRLICGNPWALSEGAHDQTTHEDTSALFYLTTFPSSLAVSNMASTF